MFKFLAFLLLLVLFGILLLGVVFGRVIRFFGSSGKSKSTRSQSNNKAQYSDTATPKKFSKNEGEYVNYEEIKDED